jgi:hypothetical protein
MKRSILLSVFIATTLLVLEGTGVGWPGTAAPTEAASPGADNIVVVSRQCMPNNLVAVTISWTASGQGVQFVDVARVNNGFIFGTFAGVGPLAASQNTLTLQGIEAGSPFFLRINTLTPSGFIASPTVEFFTDCQFVVQPFFVEPVVFVQVPFVRVPVVRVAVVQCRQFFTVNRFGFLRRRLICV